MASELQVSKRAVSGSYVNVCSYNYSEFLPVLNVMISNTVGEPKIESILRSISTRKECIVCSDDVDRLQIFVSRILIECILDFNQGECSREMLDMVLSFYRTLLEGVELSFYRTGD